MSKTPLEYAKEFVLSARQEAEQAKSNRMKLNADNFRTYQMEYDFSAKKKGQSTEILAKTRNSVEQIKSFFQQALADLDDWYRIEAADGTEGLEMPITPEEMYKMLNYQLKKAQYFSHVGYSVQSGLLGSLSISRVRGEMVPKPKFKTRTEGRGKSARKHVVMTDDKTWELRLDQIRQEDYYPDPTGSKLYEVVDTEMDLHVLRQLSEGDNAIYDRTPVNDLTPWKGSSDSLQDAKKAQETGETTTYKNLRPRVKVTEFIGTIVDDGSVSKAGEILFENVIMTLANDDVVIRKPTENPLWHQQSDIVAAALIEVVNSVWGIALMDAATKHNRTLTEMFNLMLDSAMKAVWGISQIRVNALEDPTQITDGIPWGENIKVNSELPIGGKVMEEVVTGHIQGEVINMFNLLAQEMNTSMFTSDLRMGGVSMRAVKATEVVAAENSITSVFQGLAKNFEGKKIQPELQLACWTVCQNWDLISKEVFTSIYGKRRGEELAALDPQDVFVATMNGMTFNVFGISITLRRQADFRKYTTLLQTVGASEVLIEAFMQQYSFEKFLGEVMTAIDIDKSKIRQDKPADPAAPATPEQPPAPGPDMASQQPSAANVPEGGPLASMLSGMQMNAPSSQALG